MTKFDVYYYLGLAVACMLSALTAKLVTESFWVAFLIGLAYGLIYVTIWFFVPERWFRD